MTNSEAIEVIRKTSDGKSCKKCRIFDECFNDKCGNADDLAIKSLEENDKLKAEIKQLKEEVIGINNHVAYYNSFKEYRKLYSEAKAEIETLKQKLLDETDKQEFEIERLSNINNSLIKSNDNQRKEIEQLKSELEQSVKLPIKIGDYGYVVNIESINGEIVTVVRKVKICMYCVDSLHLITKFKLNDNIYELVSDYVYSTQEEAEQSLKGGAE